MKVKCPTCQGRFDAAYGKPSPEREDTCPYCGVWYRWTRGIADPVFFTKIPAPPRVSPIEEVVLDRLVYRKAHPSLAILFWGTVRELRDRVADGKTIEISKHYKRNGAYFDIRGDLNVAQEHGEILLIQGTYHIVTHGDKHD